MQDLAFHPDHPGDQAILENVAKRAGKKDSTYHAHLAVIHDIGEKVVTYMETHHLDALVFPSLPFGGGDRTWRRLGEHSGKQRFLTYGKSRRSLLPPPTLLRSAGSARYP